MNVNHQIARAVAAILGTHVGFAAAADQPASDTGASAASIQEVIVTAQRRSENAQDVPIAIQALTGASDFIRHWIGRHPQGAVPHSRGLPRSRA